MAASSLQRSLQIVEPDHNHPPPPSEICTDLRSHTAVDGFQTEARRTPPPPPHETIASARYGGGKARQEHVSTSVQRGAGAIEKKKSLSPVLRWFPRKKTESFLERKIRMLQEKEGGSIAPLDETLGAGGVHLCRVEREKLAARAVALQAMEARKQALIEASWCRIIKLAGIPCNLAILKLQEAERKASAATVEAEKLGVILHTGPPPPADSDSTASEAVTASFDSAFEVDKDVANAIKEALEYLEHQAADGYGNGNHIPNSDLLPSQHKSSSHKQHKSNRPDRVEEEQGGELKNERDADGAEGLNYRAIEEAEEGKRSSMCQSIASMMLERIVELSAEDRASLARIVATCGLSALLKDQTLVEQGESVDGSPTSTGEEHSAPACDIGSILVKHVSRLQREIEASKVRSTQEPELCVSTRRQQKETPVESLDQILVKHVSKLEKEKLAAAQEACEQTSVKVMKPDSVSIECGRGSVSTNGLSDRHVHDKRKHKETGMESLDQILVKHVSRLEKEKLAAAVPEASSLADMKLNNAVEHKQESMRGEEKLRDVKRKQIEIPIGSLDQILVKHISKLEKEKLAAAQRGSTQTWRKETRSETVDGEHGMDTYVKRKERETPTDTLDQILVKHVSKLEKEKLAAALEASKQTSIMMMNGSESSEGTGNGGLSDGEGLSEVCNLERRPLSEIADTVTTTSLEKPEKKRGHNASYGRIRHNHDGVTSELVPDLASILVKHVSRLQREKETMKEMAMPTEVNNPKGSQRLHHEANVPDLGSILVKHVSRLEKEKAKHAEKENQASSRSEVSVDASLGDVSCGGEDLLSDHCKETALAKKQVVETHSSRSKSQGRKQGELGVVDHFSRRKLVREQQMEDVWGGLSLGNAMKRHVSKLELEQAAWRKAEEEARKQPNMQ